MNLNGSVLLLRIAFYGVCLTILNVHCEKEKKTDQFFLISQNSNKLVENKFIELFPIFSVNASSSSAKFESNKFSKSSVSSNGSFSMKNFQKYYPIVKGYSSDMANSKNVTRDAIVIPTDLNIRSSKLCDKLVNIQKNSSVKAILILDESTSGSLSSPIRCEEDLRVPVFKISRSSFANDMNIEDFNTFKIERVKNTPSIPVASNAVNFGMLQTKNENQRHVSADPIKERPPPGQNQGTDQSILPMLQVGLVLISVVFTVSFFISFLLHVRLLRRRRHETRRGRLSGTASYALDHHPGHIINGRHQSQPAEEVLTKEQLSSMETKKYSKRKPVDSYSPSISSHKERGAGINNTSAESPQSTQQEDYNQMCPVCLDEFKKGETVRVLPCDHLYHPPCIEPWLLTKSTKCPLCKCDTKAALEKGQSAKRTQPPTLPITSTEIDASEDQLVASPDRRLPNVDVPSSRPYSFFSFWGEYFNSPTSRNSRSTCNMNV